MSESGEGYNPPEQNSQASTEASNQVLKNLKMQVNTLALKSAAAGGGLANAYFQYAEGHYTAAGLLAAGAIGMGISAALDGRAIRVGAESQR